MELLDEYCSRPYKGSTRREIFEKYEKPNMKPLPETMYRFRMRKEVKLGATYHVCVGSERHFYSVPFKYVGQMVKVMWDVQDVEVYVGQELVTHLNKNDLIIFDDFGLQKMDADTRLALLTLLDDRYEKKSVIITSQLPVEKWYDYIAEATLADAIMDRLANSSHHFELEGPSLRKKRS